MSGKDELHKSVDEEIKDYSEYLSHAKAIADSVPIIEERKREAEAKKIALNNIPDDVMSELAPKLWQIQQEDDEMRWQYLPRLPQVSGRDSFPISTNASTASYFAAVSTIVSTGGAATVWMDPINDAYHELAESKASRIILPGLMGEVRSDLEQMFAAAHESVAKARNGIIGIDQAAVRMRGVVEQLWGSLVSRANKECRNSVRGQRLELKKETHRQIIAECLLPLGTPKTLASLLDDLYALHQDLSPEAKNILGQDQSKLEQLYTRWVLQIEALLKILKRQKD